MYENDYMYAVERDPQYLAHFGIKGMKWGVRKARESGNTRKLGRMYRKAQKKLAKLEKRAASGKKYARRAALLGAGAAAAGGLAVAGTSGVDRLLKNTGRVARQGMRGVGSGMSAVGKAMTAHGIRGGGRLAAAGNAIGNAGMKVGSATYGAGTAVGKWGRGTSIGQSLKVGSRKLANNMSGDGAVANAYRGINKELMKSGHGSIVNQTDKLGKVSNNTFARIGAGAIGAGLAGAAGYNAYRAATTKRAAKKAAQFRSEMNKAFKGTQYANGGGNRQGKKRRNRG